MISPRHLPNILTTARLLAVPLFVWMILASEGPTSFPAAVFFGVMAFTDWLDGWLARRLKAESRFGRIADPLVDHLLIGVGLLSLIFLGRVSWPVPAIILARDATLAIGFYLLARRGFLATVDRGGKLSALTVMASVTLALAFDSAWVDALLVLAAALSLVTLANYLVKTAKGGWPRAATG